LKERNMAFITGRKHFGQYTYEHWFDNENNNIDGILIDNLRIDEISFVSNMINNTFDEFVGKDYTEEGNNTFKDYIKPQNISDRLNDKSSQFFIARNGNEIIGILEIKNKDHITLFFIEKEFHGKGIGKKLFKYYLSITKNNDPGIKMITVNSSIYAEKIYSRLGFTKTSEIQEKDGMKYIPMEYKISENPM
jgi:predicted GNAT family N-acyltransferase